MNLTQMCVLFADLKPDRDAQTVKNLNQSFNLSTDKA